VATVNSETERR